MGICLSRRAPATQPLSGPPPDPSWPPPQPYTSDTKRKDSLFNKDTFKTVDLYADSTPRDKLKGSFKDVSMYIHRRASNMQNPEQAELAKVRALFFWVATVDPTWATGGATELEPSDAVLHYMKNIQSKNGNKALLFAYMCRGADIPCVVISGITKSAAYRIGNRKVTTDMESQWNSVFVGGQWRLLDPLWAGASSSEPEESEWAPAVSREEEEEENNKSSKQKKINEFYFLTDPEQLICTHYPKKGCWQLLEQPVNKKLFLSSVYVRERFFDIGMRMLQESKMRGKVKSKGGSAEVVLPFGIQKANNSKEVSFLYQLQRNQNAKGVQMVAPLENYILQEETKNKISFRIRLPMRGQCRLDIYGKNSKDHADHDMICAYLIDCKQPNKKPFPDCPAIGWGPGTYCDHAGLVALSHKEGVVISEKDRLEFQFKVTKKLSIQTEMVSNEVDEDILKYHVTGHMSGNIFQVDVRLPKTGEYSLKVFAIEESKKESLDNVCNYLIRWDGESGKQPPADKKFPRVHSVTLGKQNLCNDVGVSTEVEGKISTNDHVVKLDFQADKSKILLCELTNGALDNDTLRQSVERLTSGQKVTFKLGLPESGEYGVNVFAKPDANSHQIHHVYSGLLHRKGKDTKKGKVNNNKGTQRRSTETTLVASDSEMLIELPKTKMPLVAEFRKRLNNGPLLNALVKLEKNGDKNKCMVKFPAEDTGLFHLDVFVLDEGRGSLTLFKSFHIWKDEDGDDEIANPRIVRLHLKLAIRSRRYHDLGKHIETMKDLGFEEDSDWELKWAVSLHTNLGVVEELKKAIKFRDLTQLEAAIAAAGDADDLEQAGLQAQVDDLLSRAKKLRGWLQRIKNDSQKAIKVNQTTMSAELKSYQKPHETVVRMLRALYYVLGEAPESLKEWDKMQILLNQKGDRSIKKRIQVFTLQNADMDKMVEGAVRAHVCLGDLTSDNVKNVSKMALPYFQWTSSIVEEIRERCEGGEEMGQWSETLERLILEDVHMQSGPRASITKIMQSISEGYGNTVAAARRGTVMVDRQSSKAESMTMSQAEGSLLPEDPDEQEMGGETPAKEIQHVGATPDEEQIGLDVPRKQSSANNIQSQGAAHETLLCEDRAGDDTVSQVSEIPI